jgi:hypothetical protein
MSEKKLEVEIDKKIYLVVFTTELAPTEKKCEFCKNLLYQRSLERIVSAQAKNPTTQKIPTSLRETVSQLVSKTECPLPSCKIKNATKARTLNKKKILLDLCRAVGIEAEILALNLG